MKDDLVDKAPVKTEPNEQSWIGIVGCGKGIIGEAGAIFEANTI